MDARKPSLSLMSCCDTQWDVIFNLSTSIDLTAEWPCLCFSEVEDGFVELCTERTVPLHASAALLDPNNSFRQAANSVSRRRAHLPAAEAVIRSHPQLEPQVVRTANSKVLLALQVQDHVLHAAAVLRTGCQLVLARNGACGGRPPPLPPEQLVDGAVVTLKT